MKNKKEKNNNFEKIQNATSKSKRLLKSTFENLFSFMESFSESTKGKIEKSEVVINNFANNKDGVNKKEDIEIIFNNIINKNIKKQEQEIEILKENFNKAAITYKRAVLIKDINNYLNNVINTEINSTALDNQQVEIISSVIILNNRLRGIRKIISKENKNIQYINNLFEIDNPLICLEKTKEIIKDSMKQIKKLKQEFIMEFYYDMDRYPETEELMTSFSNIEYQITSKERELAVMA